MMGAGKSTNFEPTVLDKYTTTDYYLNRGASGNVYGPIPWHGSQLAIKQSLFADGIVTGDIKKRIEKKKDIWTSLEHKNLLRIHLVDLTRLPKVMFIVMDYAAGGSLHKTLRSLESGNKLPIDVVTDCTKQIANGMLYLHEKHIVHRDVKSSNILLMEPFDAGNPRTILTLKIADFDEIKEHDQTATMTTFFGTCAYMAPEVMQNQQFSKASDVWSFGVVIWEMLSGDIPHKGRDQLTLMSISINGKLGDLPLEQSFPEDYKLLLKRCWESTHEDRISFREISITLQRTGYNTTDRPSVEEPRSPEAALMDTEIQKLKESEDKMARSEHGGPSGKDHEIMDTTENAVMFSDEMYGITREMIQKHKALLTDRLQDTEYGILQRLLANDGLTYQETTAIENCSANPYDRSKRLIDEVLAKNIFSQFIAALVDTDQMHLVNYLRGDGVHDVEFGDDWPLTEDRIKQLDMNQEILIDVTDSCDSGLIYTLFSEKVINKRQLSLISEESSSVSKNKAILDIIRRQSVKDYNTTILCLIKSKQQHIAEILIGPGAIQRIRVSQDGDAQIMNPIEDALGDRLSELLRDRSIEEAQRILEVTQLKIIAAKTGESI